MVEDSILVSITGTKSGNLSHHNFLCVYIHTHILLRENKHKI
jgi:hypothetical protein